MGDTPLSPQFPPPSPSLPNSTVDRRLSVGEEPGKGTGDTKVFEFLDPRPLRYDVVVVFGVLVTVFENCLRLS